MTLPDESKVERRRAFMAQVESTASPASWRANHGYKSHPGGSRTTSFGVTPSTLDSLNLQLSDAFIRDELCEVVNVQNIDSSVFGPMTKHEVRLPSNGGYIVGYEFTDNRDDGNSGDLLVLKADRDEVVFELVPAFCRNAMWTLKVFTVDRQKYIEELK